MKKIIIIAVMAGIARPSFAQTRDYAPGTGGQFDLPGMSAPELKAMSPAGAAAVEPEMARVKGQTASEKIKFDLVSAADRKDYISKASLWIPEGSMKTESMDFKKGPFDPLKYLPEELVTCKYIPMAIAYDGVKPSGMTPKFKCEDPKGKKHKVKYGKQNGEVITEVAATWILTAIGAYADRMYPVTLTCPDCPSDPFVSESDIGAWPAASQVAIEDKIGERIEVTPNSGIGFNEFYMIEDRVGAEALLAITQFLGNTDNKAPNQAIACLKEDTAADPVTGKAKCLKPFVYMQDTGITFGGRGLYHNSRMNFKAWAAETVWLDPAKCILRLQTAPTSTLTGIDASGRDLHQIGEKARQMLVRRLSMLSREQLADIFTAARAPQRAPQHTAEEWADLFLSKVEQLRNPMGNTGEGTFSCPYEVVPENSAAAAVQPAH